MSTVETANDTRVVFCQVDLQDRDGETLAFVSFADAEIEQPLAKLREALDRLQAGAGGDEAAFFRGVAAWLKPLGVECGEDAARMLVEAVRGLPEPDFSAALDAALAEGPRVEPE
jgi:hypothetical protein